MNRAARAHIIRWFILIAAQILIFNQIQFSGYINPYIYIFALILLPPGMGRVSSLFVGFITGAVMDMFTYDPGLHTASSVFLMYIRPFILRLFTARAQDEIEEISPRIIGMPRFIVYAGLLIFCHHFFLFLLENFSFYGLHRVLSRSLLSGIFTLIIFLLLYFLIQDRKKR
jgi:hypothetical protein